MTREVQRTSHSLSRYCATFPSSCWMVFVDGGRALRRQVDLGVRQRDQVEVTRGLQGGETVVTSGQIRLRDGAAVQTAASADGGEG